MRKLTVTLVFVLLAALSLAQTLTVKFGSAGKHDVWTGKTVGSEPPTTGVNTEQADADLELAGTASTDTVFAWDHTSNNIAAVSLAEARKGIGWEIAPQDYKFVGEVHVTVQSGGKPVSSANVELNDGKTKQQRLVDNGEAIFFGVKPGDLKISVQYNSGGKLADPITQILSAPLNRTTAIPSITIALPLPTSTGSNSAATTDAAPKEGEKDTKGASGGFGFGSMIVLLVALGVAGAVGYFLVQYFKTNSDQVGSKLEQLGVQIPKPGDDPLMNADPVVAVPVAKPAPPEKIILDDADPLIPAAAASAPFTASSAPVTGEPKLVSESGDVLPLSEGELTVGREIGLGLSLVGESTVSRRHAAVVRNGQVVSVKDFGSTNGTWVNGSKVTGDVVLRPGDAVQFGSVKFRFEG